MGFGAAMWFCRHDAASLGARHLSYQHEKAAADQHVLDVMDEEERAINADHIKPYDYEQPALEHRAPNVD